MNCLSNIHSLPLSVSESTVPMEIACFFCKFMLYCGRWLLTAETCRTLTLPHFLRRQQILAVEQLQVPLGISFDTAVVEGEECTYKAVGLFKPHVTILTACKCTEMFFRNSEDAQEAKISTTRRPRGSQLTEALLPTACGMFCSVPIPSSKPHIGVLGPTVKAGICSTPCWELPTWDLGAAKINTLLASGALSYLRCLRVTGRTHWGILCIFQLCLVRLCSAV